MGTDLQADRGAATDESGRRRYDSPLRARRAQETRTTLLVAATELFTADGWSATGMRDVARAAGVAVETLYKHFPSKLALFNAVIDQAAAGDDQPLAVAERPEFLAMGRGRRADRIRAAAALLRSIHERTAPFARLIRSAAGADPTIATVLADTRERQRADVEAGLTLLLGRPPTGAERDGTWALASPELYLLLVEESGWTPEAYEAWLSHTLARVLPAS